MSTEPKYLAWTDLETSGTDENRDQILEIGLVITGMDLVALNAVSLLVSPGPYGLNDDFILSCDPVVRKMHQENGLWDDLRRDGVPVREAEQGVARFLGHYGKKHDFVLAGSGVSHFDRRFISKQMPEFDKWFRYYCIDVGVLRRTLGIIGADKLVRPPQDVVKRHRALDDALMHLDELRFMRDQLGVLL